MYCEDHLHHVILCLHLSSLNLMWRYVIFTINNASILGCQLLKENFILLYVGICFFACSLLQIFLQLNCESFCFLVFVVVLSFIMHIWVLSWMWKLFCNFCNFFNFGWDGVFVLRYCLCKVLVGCYGTGVAVHAGLSTAAVFQEQVFSESHRTCFSL